MKHSADSWACDWVGWVCGWEPDTNTRCSKIQNIWAWSWYTKMETKLPFVFCQWCYVVQMTLIIYAYSLKSKNNYPQICLNYHFFFKKQNKTILYLSNYITICFVIQPGQVGSRLLRNQQRLLPIERNGVESMSESKQEINMCQYTFSWSTIKSAPSIIVIHILNSW